MIYKNLAHHSRRNAEKVRAILITRATRVHQPQVGLVNQNGGL